MTILAIVAFTDQSPTAESTSAYPIAGRLAVRAGLGSVSGSLSSSVEVRGASTTAPEPIDRSALFGSPSDHEQTNAGLSKAAVTPFGLTVR
jgi:hypothetical protein